MCGSRLVLVGLLDFKSSGGQLTWPRWVRFPRTPAIFVPPIGLLGRPWGRRIEFTRGVGMRRVDREASVN